MSWRSVKTLSKEQTKEFHTEYKQKSKFIVDECMGYEVAEVLNDLGWNAKYVSDVNLISKSDKDVFQYGFKNNRIILTHDNDFLDNRRFPFNCNPGVIIFPGGNGDEKILVRLLADMLIAIAPYGEIYKGSKIRFYEDREFRVSYLHRDGYITISRYKRTKRKILEWVEDGNNFPV